MIEIDAFIICRPAEKITIVVVHRAVLPNPIATAYSPQKKPKKENRKGKSSRWVRRRGLFLSGGAVNRTALAGRPHRNPFAAWQCSTALSPVTLFVGPLMKRIVFLHLNQIASHRLEKIWGM
ncbi:hypothetical protein FOXG_20898 [Fusarium oxysporum f. sp. lycopersici 4287]|uniref:Uncharacterized protein n=1 Tax=Fusarium oxysporum f. sp. lycopersici (strain 4287 / CBS 123668 / FGSC 9935 / NRRL 34936) TaxID=426428 RepID=A0A0J9VSV7_FUSO4|nr:hypothetical protein FOXG_20898 [Fusarium oxysporum f. sp. lycopersici 4287]EWZ77929.1 hypothetical protein FOWG_17714 [Fusarium oxysporum f. sp. lycopersici MN25]KNB13725.1 hypothetical protein FOXG_20898 [Fusarium oxysporum f. sp. lycopersici 4287]